MVVPELWRFWYQVVIAAPVLGYRLHRSGTFVPKMLVGGSTVRGNWDDDDPALLRRQPRRARPGPRLRADVPGLPARTSSRRSSAAATPTPA